MQDEEKQQFAAASLSYNLEHAQLKAMFQKELQEAKSGSSQSHASPRAGASDASQPAEPDTSQNAGQSESQPQSVACPAHQSADDANDEASDAPTSSIAAMGLSDSASNKDHVMSTEQLEVLARVFRLMTDGQPGFALAKIEDKLE